VALVSVLVLASEFLDHESVGMAAQLGVGTNNPGHAAVAPQSRAAHDQTRCIFCRPADREADYRLAWVCFAQATGTPAV
jgi:hypothetical protein